MVGDLVREVSLSAPDELRTALLDLTARRLVALRVPDWLDVGVATEITDRVALRDDLVTEMNSTSDASDVPTRRWGIAFYEVLEDKSLRERYHSLAAESARAVHELWAPYPSSLDKLQETLGEAWPFGIRPETVGEREMSGTVIRLFSRGSRAPPHVDNLYRDVSSNELSAPLASQLAAITYLDVASRGGELVVWNRRLSDAQIKGGGLDEDKLGPPSSTSTPSARGTHPYPERPASRGRRGARRPPLHHVDLHWLSRAGQSIDVLDLGQLVLRKSRRGNL